MGGKKPPRATDNLQNLAPEAHHGGRTKKKGTQTHGRCAGRFLIRPFLVSFRSSSTRGCQAPSPHFRLASARNNQNGRCASKTRGVPVTSDGESTDRRLVGGESLRYRRVWAMERATRPVRVQAARRVAMTSDTGIARAGLSARGQLIMRLSGIGGYFIANPSPVKDDVEKLDRAVFSSCRQIASTNKTAERFENYPKTQLQCCWLIFCRGPGAACKHNHWMERA